MLFGKKSAPVNQAGISTNVEPNNSVAASPHIKDEDIHVMPGKFVATPMPAAKSGTKTIAKVLVLLLVFLMLVLGAAAWYILKQKKPIDNNQNNNVPVNNNNQSQANNNNNVNNIINNIINENINNSNQNNNINTNVNNIIVEPNNDQDADKDNLTLLEEALYTTDQTLADTDKDGYQDGQELINLYDPAIAGKPLAQANTVKLYKNDNFSYQILLPKKWLVQSADDQRRQINFVPDDATGEVISIKVMDNAAHQELIAWQQVLLAGQETENYRLANFSAVRTSDGKQVMFVTYDYVFIFSYDQSIVPKANFITTFNMMLKSFALIETVE